MPAQPADNNKIAQFLVSKNLATPELIKSLWPRLTPANNIGMLMVEQGLLPPAIYSKIMGFMSGQGAPASPPPPANPSARPPISVQTATPRTAETAPATEQKPVARIQAETAGINDLFRYARSIDASDLHLSVGNPVMVRRFGALVRLNDVPLDAQTIEQRIRSILTAEQGDQVERTGDCEFVYQTAQSERYRVTIMRQRAGWDLAARCIPGSIRTFESIGMPLACKGLTQWAQGLVLVTGPASCGKTATLAVLIDMINRTRPDHVITLEAPIEYLFTSDKAQITQRQVGRDTMNQEAALRAALREDPDIIVVGELRDLSTIQLAVSAAETGHLVFATMNTVSASRTIYRLIDSFPAEEQAIMRNMISESLRGIISQQLIPRKDGNGMVAAFEVLLVNSAVANMIRKDEAHQLGTAMITGKTSGMQLLEDSLRSLAAAGLIAEEEITSRSFNRTQPGMGK
jgi:twitching motility protein PilT